MEPMISMIGVNLVRERALSAMPDAPVIPDAAARHRAPGRVRRATAAGLRGVADRLAPTPVHAR